MEVTAVQFQSMLKEHNRRLKSGNGKHALFSNPRLLCYVILSTSLGAKKSSYIKQKNSLVSQQTLNQYLLHARHCTE